MFSIEKAVTLINPNLSHIYEFGVGGGGTTNMIVNKTKECFPESEFKIYGFDWFQGLPEAWVSEKNNHEAQPAGAFSQNGQIPFVPGVEFVVGLYQDTVPNFVSKAEPIALLHVDCDLYSSTKTVFDNLKNYIVKDTVIAFDEWHYRGADGFYNDHEQKAFFEFVEENNIKFEYVDFIDRDKGIETKIVIIK